MCSLVLRSSTAFRFSVSRVSDVSHIRIAETGAPGPHLSQYSREQIDLLRSNSSRIFCLEICSVTAVIIDYPLDPNNGSCMLLHLGTGLSLMAPLIFHPNRIFIYTRADWILSVCCYP